MKKRLTTYIFLIAALGIALSSVFACGCTGTGS
jgi:hypothetical protein